MEGKPSPLFDTYRNFINLNQTDLSGEAKCVSEYLCSLPSHVRATEGYLAVRAFLKSYSDSDATFNSYRIQTERMLLWSLLIANKPLLEMSRADAEDFIDFCLAPPADWISLVSHRRFSKSYESDECIANPDWRPFTVTVSKRERSLQSATYQEKRHYKMAKASIAQLFAVCSSFFQNAIDEGRADKNPFRAIRQKKVYKQPTTTDASARSLTHLQWGYVLKTAEHMADEDPERHERTLFILATLFSMYLKPVDLVGHEGWKPCMGDFRQDSSGNWWFHVISKGNKSASISVRDEYIEEYLARYRRHLGLQPLPSPNDKQPLLTTLYGRAGLTDRIIRIIVQEVFDRALGRMIDEGLNGDEVDSLRSASLHWLRHTSAAFDASVRDMKDLQSDLRHSCLSVTQITYYNSPKDHRAHSTKKLPIKKMT